MQTQQTQTPLNNNAMIVEWEKNKPKQVEESKILFRQAKYLNGRRVVSLCEEEKDIEHFHPDLEGFKILPKDLTATQFAFRIHDKTGDQRLIWDAADHREVEEAAKRFQDLMDKGWKAYAVMPDGQKGKRIFGFNAQLEEIYFDEKKESLKVKLSKFIEDFKEVVVLPRTYPG